MTSSLVSRATMIIFAAVFGLVVLDVNKHGSFNASLTGRFLKDSGALHYGNIAWTNFKIYSQQGYRWCQENVPVYIAKIRESAAPYLRIALDWLIAVLQLLLNNVKMLYGYFLEKKPLIEKWINQHAPGVIETVSAWFWQACYFIHEYTMLLLHLLLKYLGEASRWLRENVFVGSLSPENLQKYTMEAINTTQQLASQTFSWLNNKLIEVISAR